MKTPTYEEYIADIAKKKAQSKNCNKSHARSNFFYSLLLSKNHKFEEPLAVCIYCARLGYEREFSRLLPNKIRPWVDAPYIRLAECEKCEANTSKQTKSRSFGK